MINYTIYIGTMPQLVWSSITMPEFSRKFWQHENISSWEIGSEWLSVSTTLAA
jgi:hypothetical protein